MRITFDTDKTDFQALRFDTKEEWKAYLEPLTRTPKRHYSPEPLDQSPPGFPCIMLYSGSFIISRSNGNDEFPNFFILISADDSAAGTVDEDAS